MRSIVTLVTLLGPAYPATGSFITAYQVHTTPAGETPLANLSLPIGTHEITFRHPQLGVKKQTIVVKVEGMTRVTQVFQPGSPQ